MDLLDLFKPDPPQPKDAPHIVVPFFEARCKAICRGCDVLPHPIGCWKNHEFGCQRLYRQAEDYACKHGTCPIGKWDAKTKQNVIICVQHGDRYVERWNAVTRTWMPDARLCGLRVVVCHPATETQWESDTRLACRMVPEKYMTLPQLSRSMCQGMLQRDDWDYLFKADDDTYIAIRRFLEYDTFGRDYIGGGPCKWHGERYAHGGAGYFLSRRAAEIVAANMTEDEGAEDLLVGRHLRNNGIGLYVDKRLIGGGTDYHRPRPGNNVVTTHGKNTRLFYDSQRDMDSILVDAPNQDRMEQARKQRRAFLENRRRKKLVHA